MNGGGELWILTCDSESNKDWVRQIGEGDTRKECPTDAIKAGETINVRGESTEVITKGRHDPCVGIRATPIAEAMLALVLMDHYLRHRGQNADVASATPRLPGSVTP